MAHVRRLLAPGQKKGDKPKGKWQATVRHPSGQRWSKSDPLKRVVDDWANDQETKMRRGEFIDPTSGKMTLAAWWEKWSAIRRIERASKNRDESCWRNHIEPKFGKWPLSSIQSWDVEAWVTDMGKRNVGKTVAAKSLQLLKQMLTEAVRHQLIHANTAATVSAPRPPDHVDRFLSAEEEVQLVAAFDGEDQDFIELLLKTGLRWSEAASLPAIRVEMLRKRLRVHEVVDRWGNRKAPKGSSKGQRDVALTDDLILRLSRRIASPDQELVFTSPNGRRLRYDNWLRRVWYPGLERANLAAPQPTPHDLRHSYGTGLADEGVPVNQIAALMGISLRTAENYIHASERRMEAARKALAERQESGRTPDHQRTS